MASNWQASTQSPQPKQPKGQAPSPENTVLANAQVSAESYITLAGEWSQVPLQRTTHTCGSRVSAVMPKILPIFS